jgi:hypothetical protein
MQRNVSPVLAAILIIAVLAVVVFVWMTKTAPPQGVRPGSGEPPELTGEQAERRDRAQGRRDEIDTQRESRRASRLGRQNTENLGEPGRSTD